MASRTSLVDIDGNKNQLNNWVIQVLAAAPASPSQGQIWYRSNVTNGAGNGVIYYRDSSGNDIAIATGGSALSNAYVAMTDGTTTTTTVGGETLQVIAAGTGLSVAVVNNNVSFSGRDTITYTLNSAQSGANKVLLLDANGGINHGSYVNLGPQVGLVNGQLYFDSASKGVFWYSSFFGTTVHLLDAYGQNDVNGRMFFNTPPNVFASVLTAANTGDIGYVSGTGLAYADGGAIRVVVTLDGTQTLTNKTLTSPTIVTPTISGTGWTGAQHSHTTANTGGTLTHLAISDFDTQVRTSRLDQMAAPTASVSLGSQKIINLLDPTSAQDAATKNYVDISIQGFDWKLSARVATTGTNITLAGGAPTVIDGVTLVLGDRILVKDQTTSSQNGIYTVTTLGTGANGTWTRATDADSNAEVTAGLAVFISEGPTNGNNGFVLTTDDPIVLNTTGLVFTQFSGAGQITAGNGLSKAGNTLTVVSVNSGRITVGGSGIDLATIGTAGTYTQVTTDAYGRVSAGQDMILTNGIPARTAAGTWAARTITGTATRLVVTNGDGVAGNPTLDLGQPTIAGSGAAAGISLVTVDVYGRVTSTAEIISANGLPARTAAGTWSARTITGTAGNITVTNGDGVAGNPTLNLPNVGTPGTYDQVTTDAQGRVTAGSVSGSSGTLGDASATSFVVTHGLGTRNFHVTVYRSATPWDEVDVAAEHTSNTTATIRFNTAPAIGEYTVYISR